MRGLEARLGTALFERLPRGLRLTDAGRGFHAPLRRAFRLIEEAVDDLSGQRQITISVTPSLASKWLVPRLEDFVTRHPDVSVQVEARERLADFQSDGIDIAVRQSRAPISQNLQVTPLFSPEFVVVCSPELASRITGPGDLMQHVLFSDSHGLWPLFLDRAGVEWRPRMMRFNQTSLAIDAAISGQGFALANAPLVSAELASGCLVQPLSEVLIDDLGYFIVTLR